MPSASLGSDNNQNIQLKEQTTGNYTMTQYPTQSDYHSTE